MRFPRVPFKLKTDDSEIIGYLKRNNSSAFQYLREGTKEHIRELNNKPVGIYQHALNQQHKVLLPLWGEVLTDALLKLKEHDTREWDNDTKLDFKSFFHEQSLGIDELKEILENFTKSESLLYGASPTRYRDHIAHVFRVWIIGHGLLRSSCKKELDPLSRDENLEKISSLEWECMWAIIALCHDLGYPLESIEHLNDRSRASLRKFGLLPTSDMQFVFSQQMLPFHDTAIKIMSSRVVRDAENDGYLTHLQNKYYMKFLKSFDALRHGIISSLLLCKSLVYFLESEFCHDSHVPLSKEDARQFMIRREILRAIAAHTCPDIYHLRFRTLSFLLYIVDELQCWGRPTFEELQHGQHGEWEAITTINEYGSTKIDVEIEISGPDWTKREDRAPIIKQFNQLHRILRLAVDTPRIEGHQLKFAIYNSSRQAVFSLENGKIKKSPSQWWRR